MTTTEHATSVMTEHEAPTTTECTTPAAQQAPEPTVPAASRLHQFTNDYSEGAHPAVLDALVRTNLEQAGGYTTDEHCARARRLVLQACELTEDQASVEFVVGGTAANVISLCGLLERPYDAVVCTPDGHINTHETGAIEASGHKALATSDTDGFVSVAGVDAIVRANAAFGNHMTRPRVIYVSDTTELGGVYTRQRLEELAAYAHGHDMKLFLDGARLASALTAQGNDLTLPQVARLADAFYIGGTKNGLMFGEAVVIRDPQLRQDFPWLMKQHQNLLAKGRLLGVQFEAAFENGGELWYACARNANAMARMLAEGLDALGYEQFAPVASNQLFYRVETPRAQRLCEALGCEVFFDEGATQVIRFVTSWATTEAHVREALEFADSLA